MDYKKKYREIKRENKSLMDRIEDLKFEISNMKNSQEKLDDYSNHLIYELEGMRRNFLDVLNELHKCREEYNILRKILIQEKRFMILKLKISNTLVDIKYKLRSIFRIK